MKAQSAVQCAVQKPGTTIGIPLPMLFVSATLGMLAFIVPGIVLPVLIDIGRWPVREVSFLGGGVLLVWLWFQQWRRYGRDHHYHYLLMRAPGFWRGRRERLLLAGQPQLKGGRR